MSNDLTTTTTLPSIDGFDVPLSGAASGAIRGILTKFDGGDWENKDGTPVPEKLIAVDSAIVRQLWSGQKPVETIIMEPGKVYPSIDDMNAPYPVEKREVGPYGPIKPWQEQYAIYLLDPETGGLYTSINSTVGQRIACDNLRGRVAITRRLRGQHVVPVVRLSSATMKTSYGDRERPEFEILEWRDLSGPGSVAPPAVQIGAPVKEPTAAEIVGEKPDWAEGPPIAAKAGARKVPKKPAPSKSAGPHADTKPPFDDELPFGA